MNLKEKVFHIIHPDKEGNFFSSFFDLGMILLITLNAIIVILLTFQSVASRNIVALRNIEICSTLIFTIEYFLRIWTADLLYKELPKAKARLKYIFSFIAIIDMLSVLPFYLPFIIPFDLKVLKIFRIFRFLKLNRYTNAMNNIWIVLKKKSSQLFSTFFVIMLIMVMASVLMYNVEHEAQPDVFNNAFSAFWWALITFTTIGYGDIYPVTVLGRVIGAIIALLGIGLIAVPTGIIGAGFVEQIQNDKNVYEEDTIEYCKYCGKKID